MPFHAVEFSSNIACIIIQEKETEIMFVCKIRCCCQTPFIQFSSLMLLFRSAEVGIIIKKWSKLKKSWQAVQKAGLIPKSSAARAGCS